jgi:hypothetical protein
MYNVIGILELLNLLAFKLFLSHALFRCTVKLVLCAPPPPPLTISQGLVRRPMRGQELSGRLRAEHRSCREATPLGNFTCKCNLRGWNIVNQRSIHHQVNRTGKLHGSWETLQVFWGRAHFHGSTVLFWMALVLNTVYIHMSILFFQQNLQTTCKTFCFTGHNQSFLHKLKNLFETFLKKCVFLHLCI